jgi:predicted nucleic acid-binding protein
MIVVSIEEKQKSLYAALIRYSSDTQSLRERAIDHLVLIGLQDSTTQNAAVRAGDLRKIIGRGVGSQGIRIELIKESLLRLIDQGFVECNEVKHRNCYYIISSGLEEVERMSEASGEIMQPCIDRMLVDFEHSGNQEEITRACKRFIVNCFVEYGQTMAKCVTGEASTREISTYINAEVTFNKSVSGLNLNPDESESLYSRFLRFLKSQDAKDVEVKFLLTQVYYLAKLLEVDDGEFDPLAKTTFSDAIIYLDSNVVFDALITNSDNGIIDDLVKISSELNIELYVTYETLDEIDRVLSSKLKTLNKIVESLPSDLYKKSNDSIFNSFLSAQDENENLTASEYIESISNIREKLISKGITCINTDVSGEVDPEKLKDISKIVKDTAKEDKGMKKSTLVSRHDAVHLLLVKNNRANGQKSWFLSKDSTLDKVSGIIAGKRSLVFSLGSFLQSVSPFVEGV